MSAPKRELGKPFRYFDIKRTDLIALVEPGENQVLEIGCGTGSTGQALKDEGRAQKVIGVELSHDAARLAETRLDQVLRADIEKLELPFPREHFDYIICGDVLEHLHNPWRIVEMLRSHLKIEGIFLASIPNVRNWRVVKNLVIRGRWDYTSYGLLDSTHLRFFTKRNIVALFENAGFRVDCIQHSYFGPKAKLINWLFLGHAQEFLAKQYIVKARNHVNAESSHRSVELEQLFG